QPHESLADPLIGEPISFGQDRMEVRGRVIDRQGNPVPGATVSVRGTNVQVATDENGEYSISVMYGQQLVFSSLGYESREIQISLKTALPLETTLEESISSLDETVVVAYGTSKVRDVTGSISRIGK